MLEGNDEAIQRFLNIVHTDILALVARLDKPSYADDYVKRKIPERVKQAVVDAARKALAN
jgi:hypothetical protein